MINLEITEKEKKDNAEKSVLCDNPKFPYGTQVSFDPETFQKLGLAEVPEVGEKIMFFAQASVSNVSQYKTSDDQAKTSMTLQITDIEFKKVEEEKESKSTESMLYGEE